MHFRHIDSWEDEGGTPSERPSALSDALLKKRLLDQVGSFERVLVRGEVAESADIGEDARSVLGSLDGVSTLGQLVDAAAGLGMSHERVLDALVELFDRHVLEPVERRSGHRRRASGG